MWTFIQISLSWITCMTLACTMILYIYQSKSIITDYIISCFMFLLRYDLPCIFKINLLDFNVYNWNKFWKCLLGTSQNIQFMFLSSPHKINYTLFSTFIQFFFSAKCNNISFDQNSLKQVHNPISSNIKKYLFLNLFRNYPNSHSRHLDKKYFIFFRYG